MKIRCRWSIVVPVLLFAACQKESNAAPAEPVGAELPPALLDKLARADAADGAADKVVHKCAGCALAMAGKKEMAVTVAGYEMHFCKEACKVRYERDAKGELEKLKVPQ